MTQPRKPHTSIRARIIFFTFLFLALIQVPLIEFKGDDIGLFDLIFSLYLYLGVLIILVKQQFSLGKGKDRILFLNYFLFVFYVFLLFLFYFSLGKTNIFSIAVLGKQIQFVCISILAYSFLNTIQLNKFHRYIYLILITLFINGIYKMFIDHSWYRIGLIFKDGVSSNPAGLVISTCLLILFFMAHDPIYKKKIDTFWLSVFFFIGYTTLILTFSRTNNIAFIFFLFLYSFIYYKWKFINILLISICVFGFTLFIFNSTGVKIYSNHLPIEYILNPSLITSDHSFHTRMTTNWYLGYAEWNKNLFNSFFGLGLGAVRLNDSLYLHLLYTTGLLGSAIYYSCFFILLLLYDMRVKILTLFVVLNGVSTETTILSYRATQIFLILFIFLIVWINRRSEYDHDTSYLNNHTNL